MIAHCLKVGGYWVNLGPLLYHWADGYGTVRCARARASSYAAEGAQDRLQGDRWVVRGARLRRRVVAAPPRPSKAQRAHHPRAAGPSSAKWPASPRCERTRPRWLCCTTVLVRAQSELSLELSLAEIRRAAEALGLSMVREESNVAAPYIGARRTARARVVAPSPLGLPPAKRARPVQSAPACSPAVAHSVLAAANVRSMYQTVYQTSFWTMQKTRELPAASAEALRQYHHAHPLPLQHQDR